MDKLYLIGIYVGKVIAFLGLSTNLADRLEFTEAEREILRAFGTVPGYIVAFENDGSGNEWASIGASSGEFSLLDLLRIKVVAGGYAVVDGSQRQPAPWGDIEEAVIAAWTTVRRRMVTFGLR